jgi:hypothetical protein
MMSKLLAGFFSLVLSVVLSAAIALATAPAGDKPPDYSGISGLYYTLIGLILAYGVYDAFFKKT